MNISPVKATNALQSAAKVINKSMAADTAVQNIASATKKGIMPPSNPYDKQGNLNLYIKKMLNNAKFVFENEDKPQLASIKDFIKGSVEFERDYDVCGMYHATPTKEIANKIIENGFDVDKISRTKYGPGFYFVANEGHARDSYGSALLSVDLKGKAAKLKNNWYDAILNSGVREKIKQYANVDDSQATNILKKYVMNCLSKDLGYDYGLVNGYTICFNPKAIKNIQPFW